MKLPPADEIHDHEGRFSTVHDSITDAVREDLRNGNRCVVLDISEQLIWLFHG